MSIEIGRVQLLSACVSFSLLSSVAEWVPPRQRCRLLIFTCWCCPLCTCWLCWPSCCCTSTVVLLLLNPSCDGQQRGERREEEKKTKRKRKGKRGRSETSQRLTRHRPFVVYMHSQTHDLDTRWDTLHAQHSLPSRSTQHTHNNNATSTQTIHQRKSKSIRLSTDINTALKSYHCNWLHVDSSSVSSACCKCILNLQPWQ